ncbi:MAG: TonB-dependent siderophore receptor [Dyadobacter fermentans]
MKSLFQNSSPFPYPTKIPGSPARPSRLSRLFTLLIFMAFTAASAHAQSSVLQKRITVQQADIPLGDALLLLGDKAGCTFSYSSSLIDPQRKVQLQYDNVPLGRILEDLLGEVAKGARVQDNGSGVPQVAIRPVRRTGAIKGEIRTSDGKPAGFVNVSIKGLGKGTVADENGSFTIRNVPDGAQTVVVRLIGYEAVEQACTVEPGMVSELPVIHIQESSSTLQEVIVQGNVNAFANKETDYAARMPLKNLENAQVYNVISKEFLNQQLVVDYKDALKTAPGVVPFISAAGTNLAYIRGFPVQASVRNGLATQTWTLVDPGNIERIEILKGPSGTLFGANNVSFGAVVNRVTKKPMETFRGELSYSLGSWNLSRLLVDINTPVNADKTALFRVNAALHEEKTFQNFGGNKSYIVAPSFSYKVNDRLSFLFETEFFKGQMIQQPYNVLTTDVTFRNLNALKPFYKNSFAGSDLEGTKISNNFYAVANYRISDRWTSQTGLAYSFNREADQFQLTANWLNDTTVARTFWKNLRRDFSTLNLQQNFNGEYYTGNMRHRIVLGINLIRNTDDRFVVEDPRYDTLNPARPFKPFFRDKADAIVARSTIQNSHLDWMTYSAYFSNVSNITDRLLLMLSLRFDRYDKNNSTRNGTVSVDAYQQNALSPKLGLIYQVVKDQVSLFANYMNGFNNVGPVTQPNGEVLELKPQRANQWEGGVKMETFNKKLSATVSIYDIRVSNSTRTNEQQFTVQDGTQRSRGTDLEIIANPWKGFNIQAGYSYNKNTYLKADESMEGKWVTGSPKNIFTAWLTYKHTGRVLNNVGVGFGGNYVDDVFYDAANLFVVPAYTLLNGTVYYEKAKWRIGLKVNNITNTEYFNAWSYPQPTRQLIGNLTFKF